MQQKQNTFAATAAPEKVDCYIPHKAPLPLKAQVFTII